LEIERRACPLSKRYETILGATQWVALNRNMRAASGDLTSRPYTDDFAAATSRIARA